MAITAKPPAPTAIAMTSWFSTDKASKNEPAGAGAGGDDGGDDTTTETVGDVTTVSTLTEIHKSCSVKKGDREKRRGYFCHINTHCMHTTPVSSSGALHTLFHSRNAPR